MSRPKASSSLEECTHVLKAFNCFTSALALVIDKSQGSNTEGHAPQGLAAFTSQVQLVLNYTA